MTRKKSSIVRAATGYDAVLADVVALIDAGRRADLRLDNGGTPFLAMLDASPRMAPVALEVARQFLAHGAVPARAYEAPRKPMTGFEAVRMKKRMGWTASDVVRERVATVAPDLASALASLIT